MSNTFQNTKKLCPEIQDHQNRVSYLSYVFSLYSGLSKKEALDNMLAGKYHDIGKYRIPESIRNKPGKLTKEEFQIMKKHSSFSYEILKKRGMDENVCKIVLFHHEMYALDGGYPNGIRGELIPLGSRILKICDYYEALTSKRIYRNNEYQSFEAYQIMEENEKEFDPNLLTKFGNMIKSTVLDSSTKNLRI